MRRRAYLATAAAVGLAGCGAFAGDDNGDDDDEGEREPDEDTVEIERLDDFSDLDAWETVVGTLRATEEAAVGDQGAAIEPGTADQVRIVREFEEPIDATGMNAGLAVTADGPVAPVVQLVDERGDWLEFRQVVYGDAPLERVNFGLADVVGDVDPTAITEVHIARWIGEEPEGVGDLYVDDLHLVPRPEEGLVMLQFAGGHTQIHDVGLPALEGHDLEVTAFVPPGRLREWPEDLGTRMTYEQVETLAEAGWTVASQSHRDQHFTGLDQAEQEADVRDAVEWLEENGYGEGARYLSFPADRYDESALSIAAEYHDLAFAGKYPVHGYTVSPMRCGRVMNPTASEAEAAIDSTATYGGITTLCYYGLRETDEQEAMEATVEMLAQRAEDGDVRVVSPATVADEYVI